MTQIQIEIQQEDGSSVDEFSDRRFLEDNRAVIEHGIAAFNAAFHDFPTHLQIIKYFNGGALFYFSGKDDIPERSLGLAVGIKTPQQAPHNVRVH